MIPKSGADYEFSSILLIKALVIPREKPEARADHPSHQGKPYHSSVEMSGKRKIRPPLCVRREVLRLMRQQKVENIRYRFPQKAPQHSAVQFGKPPPAEIFRRKLASPHRQLCFFDFQKLAGVLQRCTPRLFMAELYFS